MSRMFMLRKHSCPCANAEINLNSELSQLSMLPEVAGYYRRRRWKFGRAGDPLAVCFGLLRFAVKAFSVVFRFPDYFTECPDSQADSAFIAAAEAENQAALRSPAHITGREWAGIDPALCALADNLKVIHTSRQKRRKMQTGVGVAWPEEFPEMPTESFDQRISPAEIDRPHSP